MFPVDRAPEALDEGIIGGLAPAVAADVAAGCAQGLLVSVTGELTALGGIKNIRGRGAMQGGVQDLQVKAYVERAGKLPAEYIAQVPVEHGDQLQKVFGHGHSDNVRARSAAPAAPELYGGPWLGGLIAGRDRA